MNMHKNYVVDTNLILDYIDILPSPEGQGRTLDHPSIDLNGANIIIPDTVFFELDNFKEDKEDLHRAFTAREAARRISAIIGGTEFDMRKVYHLDQPIKIRGTNRTLSILPLHHDFEKALPYSTTDMPPGFASDGRIVSTALAAICALNHVEIDGRESLLDRSQPLDNSSVVLLSNDYNLRSFAALHGVKASNFNYRFPVLYTGRREVALPDDLFKDFVYSKSTGIIPLEDWLSLFPDAKPLVANEFLVFKPASGKYPDDYDPNDGYFRYIGRYHPQLECIAGLEFITKFPVTPKNAGQAAYADVLCDNDIRCVLAIGPAGTGKTFLATSYGIRACQEGRYNGVVAVACRSVGNYGAVPGNLDRKLAAFLRPVRDAMRNFVYQQRDKNNSSQTNNKNAVLSEVDQLWEKWVENIPASELKGKDFYREFAILDEAQDLSNERVHSFLTRPGGQAPSKLVLTGDISQIDPKSRRTKHNNGLSYARRLLYNLPMVAIVPLTAKEGVRDELVNAINQRMEENWLAHCPIPY